MIMMPRRSFGWISVRLCMKWVIVWVLWESFLFVCWNQFSLTFANRVHIHTEIVERLLWQVERSLSWRHIQCVRHRTSQMFIRRGDQQLQPQWCSWWENGFFVQWAANRRLLWDYGLEDPEIIFCLCVDNVWIKRIISVTSIFWIRRK